MTDTVATPGRHPSALFFAGFFLVWVAGTWAMAPLPWGERLLGGAAYSVAGVALAWAVEGAIRGASRRALPASVAAVLLLGGVAWMSVIGAPGLRGRVEARQPKAPIPAEAQEALRGIENLVRRLEGS